MSALLSGYITLDKLKEIVRVVESKNEKGFDFTASIGEETNQYGQNVSFYASQSKDEREAKKTKYYFSNGKVFWTDGKIQVATKKDAAPVQSAAPPDTDLPF